jgi:hypothetical protein
MKVYLMSSPILREPGQYAYRRVSLEEASGMLKGGFVSAVQYQPAADMLRDLLGVTVPINRREARMEVGDMAVVVELPEPDPSGGVSGEGICAGVITRKA